MPRMNLVIDQPLDGWSTTNPAEVAGDIRQYYAAPPPLRVLLVTRSGLTIDDLRQDMTVLAQIGIDYGTPGFVTAEGRRHTKISVLAAAPDAALPTSTLSSVLERAPGAKRRGRQRLAADEPTVRVTASVPESYRQAVQAAGYGDISAGVRRIISEWLAAQKGGERSVPENGDAGLVASVHRPSRGRTGKRQEGTNLNMEMYQITSEFIVSGSPVFEKGERLTFRQVVDRIEEEAKKERDFLFASVADVFVNEDIIVLKTLGGAAYEVAKKV